MVPNQISHPWTQEELDFLKTNYKDQPDHLANLQKIEVRDTIASMIQNRKVIVWLKEKMTKAI